jgi:hypothetical protein
VSAASADMDRADAPKVASRQAMDFSMNFVSRLSLEGWRRGLSPAKSRIMEFSARFAPACNRRDRSG